ncbi:MAG: glycosyltransferase family 4 protein [Anaerolineae bacterium]
MRIAMFSPLSPIQTAIADYTEGLLPGLAQRFELTLVTTGDYTPTHPLFQPGGLLAGRVISYDRFRRQTDDYDLIVYQLGDEARIHGYMFDAIPRYPGVIVLHDLVLHHAVVGLTLARGDVAGYLAEMQYAYGQTGEKMARKVIAGRGEELGIYTQYPLVERWLDNALGVIAHNNYVVEEVRRRRPGLTVQQIVQPFFLPDGFPEDFDSTTFRRELGLADRPVIASFGFFVPDKRLGLVLRAFKRLLVHYPDAIYLLVGGHSPYYDLEGELRSMGLGGKVRLTGWLSGVPFVKHMLVADVAVHLRYPHIGGTPYTPIRLLGLGVPTIISDIEPLAELPGDAVVRIKPNEADEEAMLFAAMDYLLTHRDVASAMAENGRKYVSEQHNMDLVISQFAEFLTAITVTRKSPASPTRPLNHNQSLPVTLARTAGAALAEMGLQSGSENLLRPLVEAIHSLTSSPQTPRR